MNKTSIQMYSSDLTLRDLVNMKMVLTKEEFLDLSKKWLDLSSAMHFKNYESYVIAQNAFEQGYLSAHIVYTEISDA